jgi:signal transduction histidine kinase
MEAEHKKQPAGLAKPGAADWYTAALERLVGVVQELSLARDLDSVMAIVRRAARELTGADGATFVLRDGDKCYYAEENAISPLWKGQRFPMSSCISGWAMLNAQPAVIEDIYADPRIPADAYRPTFVKSLAMVPIRKERPIGAIGNYWARQRVPAREEVAVLEALANVTSVTLENVDLYSQLQQKMRALEESNEELSRFAWSVAHDLKSPLRGIDNLSQWIEEDLRENRNVDGNIQLLRKRVRRLENLLNDILEYSHLEQRISRQDRRVDGLALIDHVLSLVHVPQGFRVEVTGEFGGIEVPLIPLQRILCNLVNNAIKHHDRESGLVRLAVSMFENHYVFSVSDDGPGIPPGYHRKIFEMFQTLKPRDTTEGSGMGLAIVKKILALYGGEIGVHSSGRGCEFRFTWPCVPNAASDGRIGSGT